MNLRLSFTSISAYSILFICISGLSRCSLLPDWMSGEKALLDESHKTRIYWNLSQVPKTSENYENKPSNLRYIVVSSEARQEGVWKGEVDLWETKSEFLDSLPKGIFFPKFTFKAGLFTGSSKLAEGEVTNPKRISFLPKMNEVWDWEGNAFPNSATSILSKRIPLEDWSLTFELSPEEAWLSKESRNLGSGTEIVWENLRTRGSLLTTDFVHPSGKTFPYADYDYRQVAFIALPRVPDALPIWIFRREKGEIWAWGMIPEELLSSQTLVRQRSIKGSKFSSFLFYDVSSNIPFTTRADLRNYPIIILSDQNNAK
ncbi:LIC_13346 family putative lipoprotein [Leptospira fluminis]|uniref:LIC_13346 family putative lipoprotein n=1 Tax=Leptospira fluminis TaxID=2484979 RepID=UPI001FE56607|nr:hypothetical protein [Leptospira fluminis]